jgi:hypothetical protein
MMIQDALGKARETDGGGLSRGSVFIREVVTDSIHNATRSFKVGLALLGGAVLVLAGVLLFNISSTRQTLTEVSRAADRRVADVKSELGTELTTLKKGRDDLAKETDDLTKRLADLEKSKDADQQVLAQLRGRLKDADDKRRALESKLSAAIAAVEADRTRLAAERERLDKERAAELERQKAEAAAKEQAAQAAKEQALRAAEASAAQAEPAPVATPSQ